MTRLETLAADVRQLRARLAQGGGPDQIKRQHDRGKLTARERVAKLLDKNGAWFELGLFVAYDQYDGQAPGAGVIPGVGTVAARPVVIVANDATGKAGSRWPETIRKMLRAQEVAMPQRVPLVCLLDSAGVHLPSRGGDAHLHERGRPLSRQERYGMPGAGPRISGAAPCRGACRARGAGAQARSSGAVRPAPGRPSHELRRARGARMPPGRGDT